MNGIIKRGLAVASSMAIGLSASMAVAQEEVFFEEITVTATKREQTLQEVPIAVSVTSGETIEKAQVLDILDLQTLVPSLRVTQLQSSGNTNFVIRGFGNGANNPGIEPSVGVFIDGVYRSRSAAAISDLPNLQRVEVLRGPQSTLFGKNASAGVISVITALPDDTFSGKAEVTAGSYGQLIVKGDVSVPISETAGFSLSAGSNTRDGYSDNLADGTDFNGRDRWNVRGQLALVPRDNISLRFLADYDEIDELCCGVGNLVSGPATGAIIGVGGAIVPNDPFGLQSFYNYSPRNQIENSGISMQADIDIGEMTLTSITAARNVTRIEDFDADFTSADIIGRNFSDTDIDTFTQELRLAGGSENVDWMVGLFYFDESVKYDTQLLLGNVTRPYTALLASMGTNPFFWDGLEAQLAPFGVQPGTFFAPGQGVSETTGQDNQALSVFAQVDWHLSDRATLTLGANFTTDEKDAFVRQVNTDVFSALDFVAIGYAGARAGGADDATATFISTTPCSATNPPPGCNALLGLQALQVLPQFVNYPNSVENGNSEDDDVTWTARLAVDVTDSLNMYASASTGFKASSWNLSRDSRPFAADLAAIQGAGLQTPNLTTGTRFAGPEESTVFEVGLKGKFARGAVNLAVFEQTIEGFQSNIFSGVGFNLANAGKQSTKGVEIDATFFATEALEFTFAGTFLDPKYDSFVGALGVNGPEDLSGKTPAGIHERSMTGSATYTKDFANGNSAFIRADYIYESEVQVVDNVPKSVASREVNVLNSSIGLSTESGWDFMVWGRNLTDDDFLLSAFPSVFQEGSLSGYANQPRTFGVTLRKAFY
ncbi:MAG: TonB-dependent receptor [Woeseia sp.]|nr:TonB-dependent receptor [Woeseia sp.]MBT8097765.1 TonB-dependent receptor [Woeseia sp.]NNE60667.1 TonB-dependent receptor [Woeseia sp.]NNL54573.1 TonB-dependent receptor [Woeseia sp.]